MKKRVISVFTAIFMAITIFSIPVFADAQTTGGDDSVYTWSSWSASAPPSGFEYESKVQYRYRDKSAPVYSGYSSLSGYTLEAKELCSTSYGSWRVTKPAETTTTDSNYRTEITSQSVNAQYSYCYVCSCKKWFHLNKNGAHVHTNGAKYYTNNILKVYHSVSLANSGYSKEYADGAYGYKANKSYVTSQSYKLGQVYMMSYNGSVITGFSAASNNIWLWKSSAGTKTLYRPVTKKYRYKYWKWGNWSSWTDSYVSSSDTRNVQTRTVYRYKIYPEKQTIKSNYSSSITKTCSGTTFNLGATAKTTLSYSSSNTNVATVSSKGDVKVKNPGTAVISIKAAQTSKYYSAVKKITVKASLKKPSVTVSKGGKKGQINIKFKSVYSADQYVIYRYDSKKGYIQRFRITKTSSANKYLTQIRKYNSKTKKYYWSNLKTTKGLPIITETGLKSGKRYYYKVKAIDNYSGTGKLSEKSSALAK